MILPFFSNLPPQPLALWIYCAAAALPAAPAVCQVTWLWGSIQTGSFQDCDAHDFTFTTENSRLQWLIMRLLGRERPAGRRRGRGWGWWDICLGVTQHTRFFFCWWQMPRSRPVGRQRFEGMSRQSGSWSDFVSAGAVHSRAIKSVKGGKYFFLDTSGGSFVSCL